MRSLIAGTSRLLTTSSASASLARAHLGLAQSPVRYFGEPVVLSSPRPLAQAKDAAELIDIDYEAMPSVTDTAEGAIAVWDNMPSSGSSRLSRSNLRSAPKRPHTWSSVITFHWRAKYVLTRLPW
jgi:aerobic carbon-monoxide dehydrogenase large subunit